MPWDCPYVFRKPKLDLISLRPALESTISASTARSSATTQTALLNFARRGSSSTPAVGELNARENHFHKPGRDLRRGVSVLPGPFSPLESPRRKDQPTRDRPRSAPA